SRMGRPPATSARRLEAVALGLFSKQGYAQTTVDQIASAAGVNKRTFFRYFASKASVLSHDFEADVELITNALAETSPTLPLMTAIREAVIVASRFPAEEVPRFRARVAILNSEPELTARNAIHHEAWARAVSDFVSVRIGQPADSLFPLAIGRATLATCLSAYDRWAAQDDPDYTVYLDVALRALASGFSDDRIGNERTATQSVR
ncbi:MAG: transcriptional regulator, TetR family, partial [Pseudonocardiales bacterium]|nr:transcriptional regulator, TetR family [Pseudonocardiales bacterium]